jgi:hypothetical protein
MALSTKARARRISNGPSIEAPLAMAAAGCGFERDQGLAHGRTRHAELRRELPLSRQPASDGKLALIDQKPQLIGNSPIKPAWFNGL